MNKQMQLNLEEGWTGLEKMARECLQCGTCTASCPHADYMDFVPRQLWRMILTGNKEDIFQTKTFWLCSTCYSCTLRCPRGLPLTQAMGSLKRIAGEKEDPRQKKLSAFYNAFMQNVSKNGRVNEAEMMKDYFKLKKDLLEPFNFLPLGTKLLLRGKVHPLKGKFHPLHFFRAKGKLEYMFKKSEELEKK
jgi:heterodisulfide reductase subunit C